MASVALLGTGSSRGALDPFQRAMTFHQFVYKVDATGLTNLNGTPVFFISVEDAYFIWWWELWTSDGTPEGTLPFKRAYTGWKAPFITLRTRFDNTLFFSANGVLDKADAQSWKNRGGQWRTDGTSAGTLLLDPGSPDLFAFEGELYFRTARAGGPCTLYKMARPGLMPAPSWFAS
jgi:hypothetical protein